VTNKTVEIILFASDLLFPLWLVILMILLKKQGVKTWKAWGISSTLCIIQAYIVAKTIGWNLGGYLIIFIASVPCMLFGNDRVSNDMTAALFWIIPPVVFIVFPSLILYFLSKRKTGP
jgi:hypothetical protein